MNASEYRAAAIVADILKIIPTLAFGEIAGLIVYVGERQGAVSNPWLFYIAFLGLVISGIVSLVGLSLFVQPLADDKSPIDDRGVRVSTVSAFWILVFASIFAAFALAFSVPNDGKSLFKDRTNSTAAPTVIIPKQTKR